MPLYVDRRGLPILRLRYIGRYSDDELLQFLSEIDSVLKLPGRKACMIDLIAAKAGNARQRRLQGDWIHQNEELLARDFSAVAIVTDSAVMRGVVTAVFWIRPLPIPTCVAATTGDAERWLAPYIVDLMPTG